MFTFTAAIAILASLIGTTSGTTRYNSGTQICCNGTVSPRENHDTCCGQQPYEYAKSLCCDGQLFDIAEDSNMACCTNENPEESTIYDQTKEGCCYGEVFDKPEDYGDYSCCNSKPYNYTNQGCCDGVVFDKPEDIYYSCCGNKPYNYTTETCCGNTITKVEDAKGCCGDEEYDDSSEICCSSWDDSEKKYVYSTIDLEGDATECCNGDAYDPSEQICCDNELVNLPDDLEDSSNAYCCGKVPYVYGEQACCTQWVEVEESKESEYLYHLLDIVDNRDICCGKNLYNGTNEVCCDPTTSKVGKLPTGADDNGYYRCCGKDDKVYDGYKDLCVDGQVVPQPDDNSRACGKDIINYSNQSCCYDQAFDDEGPWQCCHGTTKGLYNINEEICCDGVLVDLSDEDKAAGNNAYCSAW